LFKNITLLFIVAALCICCFSCREKQHPGISFYYWKTTFALNQQESNVLHANEVQGLYVRYFDIETDKTLHKPLPIGIVHFADSIIHQKITPVIYIKNEVFKDINDNGIDSLSKNILHLVQQINNTIHQTPNTIQFDCDWTLTTKDTYFKFLKKYKQISACTTSATIRLHQIKHWVNTGFPPVDKGVLMFYNMGKIDAGNNNSIYDSKIAASYLEPLKNYTLPLDIALPIFSWSIQIRNHQVVHLLNKMNERHFDSDTAFIKTSKDRYRVAFSCFKGSYYFIKDDEVKVEQVSGNDLEDMTRLIQKHNKQTIHQIIFYDLDAFNLNNYETDTYQKVARYFN